MCEHCSTGTSWIKSFGEEDGVCEYSLEPEEGREWSGGCPNHPVAWSIERFVEDHLCQRHMEEEDVSLDEGLGEFLREGGLQVSTDFLRLQSCNCRHVLTWFLPTSLARTGVRAGNRLNMPRWSLNVGVSAKNIWRSGDRDVSCTRAGIKEVDANYRFLCAFWIADCKMPRSSHNSMPRFVSCWASKSLPK